MQDGIDPARERRLDRLERKINAGNSYGDVAADYIRVKYESEGKAMATINEKYFAGAALKLERIKPRSRITRKKCGHG